MCGEKFFFFFFQPWWAPNMLKNKNKNKKADSAGHTLGDTQGLGLDTRE